MSDGIGALVRLGAWLEDSSLKMEILGMGRSAFEPEGACALEVVGTHLLFAILLDGKGSLALLAQESDKPAGSLELLVCLPDNVESFRTLSRLLRAFEDNNVKSLQRPIEVGAGGSESWVIGA